MWMVCLSNRCWLYCGAAADGCGESRYLHGVMSTHELVELARSVTRDVFVAQVATRFLVLGTGASAAASTSSAGMTGGGQQRPISFATQVLKRSDRAPTSEQLQVIPLVKSANNPYADRISIGRARNCDIMIRDSGISKLHALIWMDGEAFTLADVGSQNGTCLNGRKLKANEAVPLDRNDEISFGTVPATFMDAAGLHAILKTAVADII